MAGLERLRLLIVWANLAGFLPFRMELDPATGKFRRFRFSFQHVATWWLVAASLLHAASVVYTQFTSKKHVFAAEEKLVVYLTHMVYHVNQGLLALGSYLILLRWKRLAAAAQHVDRFDRLAGDALAHRPCTSQRRIAFGMSAMPVFIAVNATLKSSVKAMDPLSEVIALVDAVFYQQNLHCLFTLYHLCFYNIGQRVQYVTSLLHEERVRFDPELWRPGSLVAELKRGKRLYVHLWRATEALNSAVSPVTLFYLIITLASITLMLNFLFTVHASADSFNARILCAYSIGCYSTILLVILFSTDIPVQQVNRLKQELVLVSSHSQDEAVHLEASSFVVFLSEDHVSLSALNFFRVGTHLIPSVTGAIITYLVVLLQSNCA